MRILQVENHSEQRSKYRTEHDAATEVGRETTPIATNWTLPHTTLTHAPIRVGFVSSATLSRSGGEQCNRSTEGPPEPIFGVEPSVLRMLNHDESGSRSPTDLFPGCPAR